MKIFYFNVFMICAVNLFISCYTDDTDNNKSRTELITAAPWKRKAITSDPAYDWNGNGVYAVDLMKTIYPCELDNYEIYRKDGTFEHNEAGTKCNIADPQSWTGTWIFTNQDSKMIVDGMDEYTIVEVTSEILRYQSTFVENGVTYTHKETWSH